MKSQSKEATAAAACTLVSRRVRPEERVHYRNTGTDRACVQHASLEAAAEGECAKLQAASNPSKSKSRMAAFKDELTVSKPMQWLVPACTALMHGCASCGVSSTLVVTFGTCDLSGRGSALMLLLMPGPGAGA